MPNGEIPVRFNVIGKVESKMSLADLAIGDMCSLVSRSWDRGSKVTTLEFIKVDKPSSAQARMASVALTERRINKMAKFTDSNISPLDNAGAPPTARVVPMMLDLGCLRAMKELIAPFVTGAGEPSAETRAFAKRIDDAIETVSTEDPDVTLFLDAGDDGVGRANESPF